MATAVVPIIEHHDNHQPILLHPIKDSDTLKQSTLLPDGKPIETLNEKETWTDPKTKKTWILPKSKDFPEYINTEYGNEKYMSTEENFLDLIVSALKSSGQSEENADTPLFPYQRFVRDYLQLGTPYRSLLLEHGLGSGKTRSTIEVAKTFRKAGLKTLILTPAFLHLNFLDELHKWENPGVDIGTYYKFAHYNATGYSPGAKSKGEDVGGKGGIFEQLARLGIGFRKDDPKYGQSLFPYLYRKYGHLNLKPPEHMLIVIEEAHNLNRSFINATSAVKSLLYPLLMQAKDCKFICLSGTPVISNPFEMAPLYNIMRGPLKDGYTAFPVDEASFNSNFVDYVTRSFHNTDILMSRMVGLGSYFVGITDDKERVIFPARKDHILELETSGYQTWMHDNDLEEELGAKKPRKQKLSALPGAAEVTKNMSDAQDELTPKGTYHTRSRASCNFVFPKYVHRPRPDKRNFALLHHYVFQFKTPEGDEPAETVQDYIRVAEELQEEVEFSEDDLIEFSELTEAAEEADEEGLKAAILKIREFLSERYMYFEPEMDVKLGGFPEREFVRNCLSKEDRQMITKTIGKYPDRIKIALEELGTPPEGKKSIFNLKSLKHYSVKMAKIYEKITSDKEAGAPHVVDAPKSTESDEEPLIPIPEEEEEVQYLDEQVPPSPEEQEEQAEIKQTLNTKVKKLHDPDDPLNKPEFADVYLSDSELKKRGKVVKGGPSLVYSYFSSAEGAAIFSMILQAHGWQNFNDATVGPKELSRAKRFAFFRGGMDQALKRNILRVFNSKENVHGQLIRTIFVTQAAAEGISLFNIRQIHIMEPHWDNVMIEQVIGRGFRILAHRHIKDPADREINVFRYYCKRPDEAKLNVWANKHDLGDYYNNFKLLEPTAMMADNLIQKIADDKDKFRKKLHKIRIKVAVDCYLNYKYNKPEDGCFSYVDKQGPAYGTSLQADLESSATKSLKTKIKKEQIQIVGITQKGVKKHYIIYPKRQRTKLRFEQTGDRLFEVIKLFGPIQEVPTDLENYVVPKSAMHAGYYHMEKKKFIPRGAGTEVS